MRVFRDIENLSQDARGATLVLGSFDGVHRGHAALITAARTYPYPVGVLTFSPHPRLLTQPAQPPFLLTPGQEKHVALRSLGVDFCVELSFTRRFASISAENFVSGILVEGLAARHLIVGDNFRFGAGRKGDVALLQELGMTFGFTVDRVAPVLDENRQAYSSTRVREYLRAGDVAGAHAILGRPWTIKVSIDVERAEDGSAVTFHFGAHLKPRTGHYSVTLHDGENRPLVAHLIVDEDDDIGRVKIGRDVGLPTANCITLEFVDFIGPLTTSRLYSEARTTVDASYI